VRERWHREADEHREADGERAGGAAVLRRSVFRAPAGCKFTTPSGVTNPCKTLSASSGQSLKLTAGSQPVLLSTASITTDNSDPVIVTAGQSKVTAS